MAGRMSYAQMFPEYRHPSGTKLSIFVLAPIFWVLCAALGWAFTRLHVLWYMGAASPLFVFIIGGTIALGGDALVRKTGCRVRLLAILVALIGALFALTVMWAEWVFLVATDVLGVNLEHLSYTEIVLDPKVALPIVRSVVEHGWYSIVDVVPRGNAILVLWALEALIIVAPALGVGRLPNHVWCEDCGQWATYSIRPAGWPDDNAAAERALERVRASDLSVFAELPDAHGDESHQPCLELWECESCRTICAARAGTRSLQEVSGKTTLIPKPNNTTLVIDASTALALRAPRRDPWESV
ncbi:MAG: hypothetical protein ACI81R_000426 [Bradymonadia bacterium]|jgi:hypothetical protein